MNEHNYLMLIDVSKDRKQREEQMEIDGGDLDNDAIEREWYQLTVLTSIEIEEAEVHKLLKEAMQTCFEAFLESYQDVRKHFVEKIGSKETLISQKLEANVSLWEPEFMTASVESGKSDQVSKE